MGKKRARTREELLGEAVASSSTGSENTPKNFKKQKVSPEKSGSIINHSQPVVKKQTRKSEPAENGSVGLGKQVDASQAVDMSIIHGLSNPLTKSKTAREFPYRPLNAGFLEIRVLTLLPAPKEAPVVCEVEHIRADRISKDAEEGYSALSYTWGSPNKTGVLYLQGVAIQVRQNLLQVS
jgi:hypothetical protein